jgi:NADH dehydrogenase FAD-containing subunit
LRSYLSQPRKLFSVHAYAPEVAASDLELNTIINPLRKLLKQIKTFVGTIEAIDLDDRLANISHGADEHLHQVPFDYLILALGCNTNFFGLPGVEASALTVKTIGDGVAIRNQVITQLEDANSECAAGERQPLLTFVVAGGGFAAVETLGGLNDFVRESLRFCPNLRSEYLRFVLVTPEEVILPETRSQAWTVRATQAGRARYRDNYLCTSNCCIGRHCYSKKRAESTIEHAYLGRWYCAQSAAKRVATTEAQRTHHGE